jgi:chemotaxis regulatin CheY-phosphate phosphatase CheZ
MEKDLVKGLQTKVKQLVKENEIKALAYKYADLENDFNYVVKINGQIADTFEIVFKLVPTSEEMQSFLTFLEKSNNVMYDKKELKDRIKVLKKFQKFIEAREKNNINMKPKRYELK